MQRHYLQTNQRGNFKGNLPSQQMTPWLGRIGFCARERQQLQDATANQKSTETQKVLIPHSDHALEASSSSPPSFLIPTAFNTEKVSHLDMGSCCCRKHMVSEGPIAALAEPPLGLR